MTIFNPGRILLEKQIKKYAPNLKGTILDIGSGKYLRYKSLFNYEKYITFDNDPKNNPDIMGSAEFIDLPENSIDNIVCTQMLGDIKNPTLVIKEFYKILKRGGFVLLTESLLNEIHDEPNDYWRFTEYGLKYLFESNGFKIVDISRRGGFYVSRAQLFIRYLIDRFDLYNKNIFTFILGPIIKIYGKSMMFLDKIDRTKANKKHTLGWCVLAKK